MEKIECSEMREIGNSVKKYYNLPNMRMMVADNYADQEGIHKHDIADQIIFVISGALRVLCNRGKIVITDNEFIHIPAGEVHKVEPLTKETKIFVLKYKSSNENISKILKEDYVRI